MTDKSDKEWSVGRLLSTSSGFWRSCTIHAGVRLGIFTALGDGRVNAAELAAALSLSERGLVMLLNALVGLGLLVHMNDTYANTAFAAMMLDKKSDRYVGHIIQHHHHLVEGWGRLHEAVASGLPVETASHGEQVERESFLMGMFNLAMAIAPQLSQSIDLAGRRNLLDLGGGPGTYAIHFCLVNPELSAVIFDRATTEPFARQTVARYGLAERIDFAAGDFIRDSLGGPYDAAWLSQILHSNPEEDCRRLINKTARALQPGGLLLIHDFFLNDSMDGPLFPALFSLNMLINNQGRSYSKAEVTEMMYDAGVRDVRRLDFTAPNDSSVLAGTMPG